MARVPTPDQTPQGPAYHGRLLDHPEEEVVDQGARFDIGTLLSRRGVLGLLGGGVAAATLAACGAEGSASAGSSGQADGEIPDETAGPYPADGSNGPDVLAESGIVRSDIRTSIGGDEEVEGVPLDFTFELIDMANDAAFAGVAVYAWHCDAQGRYSMYSEGVEDETWLRGLQVADDDGKVTFTSVFPGCYSGRWPHIHFEVYPDADSIDDPENAIATSQLALPEDACTDVYALAAYDGSSKNLSGVTLASDNVFGEDSGVLQLPTITGDADTGYQVSLVVRIDTTTEPTGGSAPGGGEGGGEGGGPPTGGGSPPSGGTPPDGPPPSDAEPEGS